MTEPAPRTLDVRVGSSTDALTPVSSAERSLAARAQQWAGLGAVVVAAIAADQLTKLIVASQLDTRRGPARDRPLLDPSRPELRDRLRALRERDAGGDAADRAGGRMDAALLRAFRLAPPGAAGRARPADRRLDLEPDRPDPARARDRLPRPALLAGVQPRRQLHRGRRRDPVRGALCSARPGNADRTQDRRPCRGRGRAARSLPCLAARGRLARGG